MDKELSELVKKAGRNFDAPPLHLWQPEFSGDIDINIDREGVWFHEGGKIERDSIVRLFAAILRREDDGNYYLVTPGEKWRIRVEALPLIVTDVEYSPNPSESDVLMATLNTGKIVSIDSDHPLYLEPAADNIAAVKLSHGLAALCSRAAWYRLVEMAESVDGRVCVQSGSEKYFLE
ncbi:MAG: DUF1285 domain-containing protein [Halioglobus sp.]